MVERRHAPFVDEPEQEAAMNNVHQRRWRERNLARGRIHAWLVSDLGQVEKRDGLYVAIAPCGTVVARTTSLWEAQQALKGRQEPKGPAVCIGGRPPRLEL